MKPVAYLIPVRKKELIADMEKILIIEASPRKGFSTNVAREISAQLGERCAHEVVALRDLDLRPCTGCAACFFAGSSKCPLKDDDVARVLEKMEAADGIIYVIPNYALNVPGLLKNFFDRLAYVFHRPRLFNQVCLPVVVQGIYGGKRITEYVNEVMEFWGMRTVRGTVVTGGVYPNRERAAKVRSKESQAIGKSLDRMFQEMHRTRAKSPTVFRLVLFRIARASMKYSREVLEPDKAYYVRKGWLDSAYYYDVRLNPFKQAIGTISDSVGKSMATRM